MEGAFRLLMHRYGTKVYRYCRAGLRDETLAEDVQSKVFEHAYRDLPTFDGKSHLRTWLFAIAHHRVLDAAKSRRRELAHLHADLRAEEATHLPDSRPLASEKILEKIHDERLLAALADCLLELSPNVRSAVLLRYQMAFTFDEMAKILRARAKTLEARVRRAMPVLRNCIERRTGELV